MIPPKHTLLASSRLRVINHSPREPSRHTKTPAGERGLTPGKQNADGTRSAQWVPEPNRLGCMTSLRTAGEEHAKTHQLGPAVRSADGAGSRPCRRAPGYIPKSGLANQPSSHPVVDTRPVGAPTVLAGSEAKAFHPAPVTVAAYNRYGSYCQDRLDHRVVMHTPYIISHAIISPRIRHALSHCKTLFVQ